jgi:hypothetical protein
MSPELAAEIARTLYAPFLKLGVITDDWIGPATVIVMALADREEAKLAGSLSEAERQTREFISGAIEKSRK